MHRLETQAQTCEAAASGDFPKLPACNISCTAIAEPLPSALVRMFRIPFENQCCAVLAAIHVPISPSKIATSTMTLLEVKLRHCERICSVIAGEAFVTIVATFLAFPSANEPLTFCFVTKDSATGIIFEEREKHTVITKINLSRDVN